MAKSHLQKGWEVLNVSFLPSIFHFIFSDLLQRKQYLLGLINRLVYFLFSHKLLWKNLCDKAFDSYLFFKYSYQIIKQNYWKWKPISLYVSPQCSARADADEKISELPITSLYRNIIGESSITSIYFFLNSNINIWNPHL